MIDKARFRNKMIAKTQNNRLKTKVDRWIIMKFPEAPSDKFCVDL